MKTKLGKSTLLMSAAMFLMLFTSSVFAQAEMFKLEYGDQTFQGENTLLLKKKIKESRPYLDLRSMKLDKVIIVAKSKLGYAKATLNVGYSSTAPSTITGFAEDFFNPAPYTFDRIRFKNRTGNSFGQWQVMLKGKIMVKKVIVFVKKSYVPAVLLDTFHLGYSVSTDSTYVHMRGLSKLIIKCAQGKAVILKAVAIMKNGTKKQLTGLAGIIDAGEMKSVAISGHGIQAVKIVAKAKGGQSVIKLMAKAGAQY
jgi:hypothetical protein